MKKSSMASNGSSAVQDTITRRGVFNTMALTGFQDGAILQYELAGSNAKSPYFPWRYVPGSDIGDNITRQHRDVADYIGARIKAQVRLRNNANRSGMTTSNSDIRPVLIAEQELARRGWLTNPTISQIYSTENVSNEEHSPDTIQEKVVRGGSVRKHRVRADYGASGTVVENA